MNTGQRTVASLAVVSVLLGLSGQAVAGIINVPSDELTIQAGIDAAVNGDEVVVAIGTYNEGIDFLGKTITVRSTDPNDPTVVATTIIDWPGPSWAVLIRNALGPGTVLSGFTVTGADIALNADDGILGPVITNCVFSGNSACALVFANCVFPLITNCTISGNGRGIGSFGSSVIVRNCLFENNNDGGGIQLNGAGPLGNPPEVTDCSFTQNYSALSGGGVFSSNNSSVITNCTFTNNTAWNYGGAYFSDNIDFPPNTQLVGCTFIGNSTTGPNSKGGAVSVNRASIVDCTFTDNTTSLEGGAIFGIQELVGTGLEFCGNFPDTVAAGGPINLDVACNPCPADIDGDGIVGVPDLLTLLAHWGPCP